MRVVGDNVETAVMLTHKALALANEMELDLVEISPKADPPVCKIIDYKKFLYAQKKKQKEIKAKLELSVRFQLLIKKKNQSQIIMEKN